MYSTMKISITYFHMQIKNVFQMGCTVAGLAYQLQSWKLLYCADVQNYVFVPVICFQIFREAKRLAPAIVYVPRISSWWDIVPGTFHATFLSILYSLPTDTPLLVLATAECPWTDLPPLLKDLFREVLCRTVWKAVLYWSAYSMWLFPTHYLHCTTVHMCT